MINTLVQENLSHVPNFVDRSRILPNRVLLILTHRLSLRLKISQEISSITNNNQILPIRLLMAVQLIHAI